MQSNASGAERVLCLLFVTWLLPVLSVAAHSHPSSEPLDAIQERERAIPVFPTVSQEQANAKSSIRALHRHGDGKPCIKAPSNLITALPY
jgi:hypothetical protein